MTLTFDIVLSGLVLGGMYALIALGLTLQYGVARIMNLSYGEFMIAAAFSGWAVTVVDERPDQLDPAAFPAGVALVPVKEDFSDLPLPGPDDSVAIVSRGHVTDGMAFRRLRGVPVSYLGMMGSNAKRKTLFGELRAEGWSEDELARTRSPIGLDIGAETPEEIAVAIVAELVKVRRGRRA